MKASYAVLAALSLFALAGCESFSDTSVATVRPGVSRDYLRRHFGEPLRIEPDAAGGENWYYRFTSWKTHPTSESGATISNRETTTYVSTSIEATKETEEQPVHISAEGFVTEPIPEGKIVQK